MVNNLTIYAVLHPFCTRPRELIHLADIAREVGIPHTTARLKLAYFERQGILRKEYRGRQTLFRLNFLHPNLVDNLMIAEKERLIAKCAEPLIRELVEYLHKIPKKFSIVLFGSATENSVKANDIDLLTEGDLKREDLQKFEDIWDKPIEALIVPSITGITPTLRSEVIRKHLIIQSDESIIRWMISSQ